MKSLVPVTHLTLLSFVSVMRGMKSVIGQTCSGESRPLVWGHKTVSQSVYFSNARSKGHAALGGQTHTHIHTQSSLHSSSSLQQSVQLPGKGNYLLSCLSSGFYKTQLSALRGTRDSENKRISSQLRFCSLHITGVLLKRNEKTKK